MPTAHNWIGNAVAIKHIDTITFGGTWVATDTYTITALGKTVVVTVGAAITTVDLAASLVAAWTAATMGTGYSVAPITGAFGIPEFKELTAAVSVVSTSKVILTGGTAGRKMPTFTVSTTSGSGTIAISHTTAATGPNDYNNTANFDSGAIPINGDSLTIDRPVSILDGLDQSAVTLTSLTITNQFNSACAIGLKVRNDLGYEEWRDTKLKIGATVVTITSGSGLIKLDLGTVQTAVTVFSTGTATEVGRNACQIQGINTSNAATVLSLSSTSNSSDVGIGANGELSTFATVRQDAGTVTLGPNVTIVTSVIKNGGTLISYCAIPVLTNLGDCYLYNVSTITTLNHNGGTIFDFTTSTWTTLNLNNNAVVNFDGNVSAKTVTTLAYNDSAVIVNYAQRVTASGYLLPRGRLTLSAS